MSWLMQILASLAMALGLNPVADWLKVHAPPTPHVVSAAELGVMLENSGYLADPTIAEDGSITGYTINLESGDQVIPVYLQVSADGRAVTVTAQLTPLRGLDEVAVDALAALLHLNNLENSPYVVGISDNDVVTIQFTQSLVGLTEDDFWMAMLDFTWVLADSTDLWQLDCLVNGQWMPVDPA